MTPPAPICIPSGGFAFPRSYVDGLYIRHDGATPQLNGELLSFTLAGTPQTLVKVYFDARFVTWSSNAWTLDHVTTDATYEYPPDPTTLPLPFYLALTTPPDNFRAHLLIDTGYGSSYSIVALPGGVGGYWLPPPFQT